MLLLLFSFMVLLLLQNPTALPTFQGILPYQWKANLQNKTHKYHKFYLQTKLTNQRVPYHIHNLQLQPIAGFLFIPLNDSCVESETLECKEIFCIHSHNKIKMGGSSISQLWFHESENRECSFILNTPQNHNNNKFT